MAYSAVIMGPPRSGKSSLVAAAIVYARYLAGKQVMLVPLAGPSGAREPQSSKRGRLSWIVANTDSDLWSAQECRRIDIAAQVDTLALHLWSRWLSSRRDQEHGLAEKSFRAAFNVISIDGELIGLGRNGAPSRLELIEVTGDLFFSLFLSETPSAAQRLVEQRLVAGLRQCSVVVICLPCYESWNRTVYSSVRRVLRVLQNVRTEGPPVVLALAKSDIFFAKRSLMRDGRAPFDQALRHELAEEALQADTAKYAFWQSLGSMPNIHARVCSSYGLLRRSDTLNVDLTPVPRAADMPRVSASIAPLWPPSPLELSEFVPSIPNGLEHWLPFGAVETVLSASPVAAFQGSA
jgi:hypothetical protein